MSSKIGCCCFLICSAFVLRYLTYNKKRKKLKIIRGSNKILDHELVRYGRQLVLNGWGIKAQENLKESSVLVIGAGGLGCPVISLLSGAGVGHIGVIDGDVVDESNLHRQTLHRMEFCGKPKIESIKQAVQQLNPNVKCETYFDFFGEHNALSLIEKYDLIIECTDNLASKYITNDACVISQKPLIFGAAQAFEGQYALFTPGLCCYRCLFPLPPKLENRPNCSDNGVLGPIPNIIGTMQALLALHYIGQTENYQMLGDYFYLFVGKPPSFNTYKIELPKKNVNCLACRNLTTNNSIRSINDSIKFCMKYELFSTCSIKKFNIRCKTWQDILAQNNQKKQYIIIDVRPRVQFLIWAISNSKNIPLEGIPKNESEYLKSEFVNLFKYRQLCIYVICRRGNDSKEAVDILSRFSHHSHQVFHIIGGLERLKRDYPEHSYPFY